MDTQLRTDAFLQNAMETWCDTVYRLALCQTHSTADAEDIYQDVFLRLLRDETNFQNDEHLKAWLLRVTLSRCHDFARSAWNRRTEGLTDMLPAPDVTHEECELWQAVAALPQKLSAVIHLFYEEGYSTDEIAQILHCRPATIRTRLHRARKQLKISLGGMEDEEESPPVLLRDGKSARPGFVER